NQRKSKAIQKQFKSPNHEEHEEHEGKATKKSHAEKALWSRYCGRHLEKSFLRSSSRSSCLRGFLFRLAATGTQHTQTRALRNMRIHGQSSPHSRGAHDICTLRNTRSGCGMQMVTRPSAAVRPVMPFGEPFGLSGYASVALPWLSTKRRHGTT